MDGINSWLQLAAAQTQEQPTAAVVGPQQPRDARGNYVCKGTRKCSECCFRAFIRRSLSQRPRAANAGERCKSQEGSYVIIHHEGGHGTEFHVICKSSALKFRCRPVRLQGVERFANRERWCPEEMDTVWSRRATNGQQLHCVYHVPQDFGWAPPIPLSYPELEDMFYTHV
jgi:hypothetical protein